MRNRGDHRRDSLLDLAVTAARLVSTHRVTVAFLVMVVASTALAGSALAPATPAALHTWAVSDPAVVQRHQWWTLVSSLLIARSPVQGLLVLAGGPLLGSLESRVGHRFLAIALAAGGILTVVCGLALQAVGQQVGAWWPGEVEGQAVLDPAIPVVAAVMAGSALLGPLWRRRIRLSGLGLVTVFALYNGDSADIYRFIGALVGLVAGAALARAPERPAAARIPVSFREQRNLLSLVTFVTAIGPAISALNPSGIGVLTLFRSIFGDPFPRSSVVRAACAAESAMSCAHDRAFLDTRGVAPILELFVPLLLLAIGAWGLRRGRRFALWLTVVTNAAMAVLSICVVVALQSRNQGPGLALGQQHHGVAGSIELAAWFLGPVLLPLGVAAALLRKANLFTVTAPRGRVVSFWAGGVISFVTLACLYLWVALTHQAAFFPTPSTSGLVFDTLLRFVPVNFFTDHRHAYVPRPYQLRAVFHWVGPVFWAVVITLAVRAQTRRSPFRSARDGHRLAGLVRAGGDTLSHMATWEGNDAWFSPDGEVVIAYRLVNDVAVTVADPIGSSARLDSAIDAFTGFCDSNGWTVAFYSVHDSTRRRLRRTGFRSTEVALEAVVDPTTFTTRGKSANSIRTALNRAVKDEVSAVWASYDELPPAVQRQLVQLSRDWIATKELPEMGFTLGGLTELQDPEVRLMVALDGSGRLAGVTSWLPIYRDFAVVGWTLDVMRRANEAMPGVTEFLIASVALRLKEEGVRIMSLSGAPLATHGDVAESFQRRPLDSALAFLSRRLEPAYGFASLLKYKAKFQPRYQALYLCYRDPLQLPAIGRAIAGAYLPTVTAGEVLSLAKLVTISR